MRCRHEIWIKKKRKNRKFIKNKFLKKLCNYLKKIKKKGNIRIIKKKKNKKIKIKLKLIKKINFKNKNLNKIIVKY